MKTLTMRDRVTAGIFVAASLVGGCAQLSQVKSGEVIVRDKLVVNIDQPWNQFERSPTGDSHPTWTVDGLTVDALKFYVALADGELIAPAPPQAKGVKELRFKSGMSQQEIIGLFESLYSRGGSTFSAERIAPVTFAGSQGFRVDWSGVRQGDNVRLRGVIWGSVRDGKLSAMSFTAPALAFFAKNSPSAEKIAASARLRD